MLTGKQAARFDGEGELWGIRWVETMEKPRARTWRGQPTYLEGLRKRKGMEY